MPMWSTCWNSLPAVSRKGSLWVAVSQADASYRVGLHAFLQSRFQHVCQASVHIYLIRLRDEPLSQLSQSFIQALKPLMDKEVSRRVPLGMRMWWRSTPSSLAVTAGMADGQHHFSQRICVTE